MQYQPSWIDGKAEGQSQRKCDDRYELIKKFIPFKRPFTVFDLGANFGYFSFRLAEDFDCVNIMADKKPIGNLLHRNKGKFIWLRKHLDANALSRLSLCESFDIVLALSVVHHIKDWKKAVNSLVNMGKYVIFELPGLDDTYAVNNSVHRDLYHYVMSMPHTMLGEIESHVTKGSKRPLVVVEGREFIGIQTIDAPERDPNPVQVEIVSTDENKLINIQHTRTYESRRFIPGMNLWNWKLLNGAWPLNVPQMVRDEVERMHRFHDDLRPWNFILDGTRVWAIDYDDKLWRTEPEENGLETCLEMLK